MIKHCVFVNKKLFPSSEANQHRNHFDSTAHQTLQTFVADHFKGVFRNKEENSVDSPRLKIRVLCNVFEVQ